MAKKQTVKKQTATEAVIEQVEVNVVERPVMVETPVKTPKDSWVVEDKVYYLKAKNKPLSRSIKSSGVYFFDEEKGYERELKYCQNQRTPFVDEMTGDQRLEHIVFRNGALHVTREKQTLQRLLSLYHPDKDTLYYEYKPQVIAENELDWLEFEVEALTAAMNLDVDMAEAVMRVELGSRVSKMSSKELKRDLLLYAKRNPELFLELVNDDNVQLRNFGIKATELNIIKLSSDQRHFTWGSTDRKLMTVPFDEHPYSALAQWFKTDEGMEVYTNIEKRLS
tara:strand:- start:1046 stop:1885 length:840 start_codon:yes stop_codon:yes gene_type:complete